MSESTHGSKQRPIRSDEWQPPRGNRVLRADNDARHQSQAGEYGEGSAQEATGVGPRRAAAEPQVLNDRPGYPDNYGNVASGLYGAHGYSGEPGHPSAYAADSGVPGAAGAPGDAVDAVDDAHSDDRLRELIRERLTEDPEIDAGDVRIDVHGGSVTLTGSVANERTRDIVEQCVENCGAGAVHNQLSIG
ncbi:MAG TPA: BON domain-containing protein [Steroidobacteraceae bacterium]|jgi:hypothetical protein|nr:BON domain-containing protein [Steroidobacteraceae bacterium]